VEVVDKKRF